MNFKDIKIATVDVVALLGITLPVNAQEPLDSIADEGVVLKEVVVSSSGNGRMKMKGAVGGEMITMAGLRMAACCNLGESFNSTPSVDVSYNDAATGARQIKLLGLGGQYVQMLTENIPNFRGAAASFGLGYMPGPWMSSIQISKGASSVKNGYESVTGQINIEMLKPFTDQAMEVNGYVNHMGKAELNFTGNLHLNDAWTGGLLLHAENSFASHDDNNDSFIDAPKVRQISGLNRWRYYSEKYVTQFGIKFLDESRRSGQIGHHASHIANPYTIDIDTRRWEAFAKNAYFIDRETGTNIALILSGSIHDQDSRYGVRFYDVNQKNLYASLMFERNWNDIHAISTGVSFNGDWYDQTLNLQRQSAAGVGIDERETTPGVYAQYTWTPGHDLTVMAGLRYDHSSMYGSMVTPRLHMRWTQLEAFTIHASAGKGYRAAHPYADNSWLLASGRQIIIDENLHQEEAWNMGGGFSGKFEIGSLPFDWSTEYYYTTFRHQTVVDLNADPHAAHIMDLTGKSYSHSLLAELSCDVTSDLSLMIAGRYNDVRLDFGRGLEQKPLSSKWKGLFTLSWKPMMGLWHIDGSLAINGGGRMPRSYALDDGAMAWNERYKAFPQLNLQVTRDFPHWSVYIGGENLTGYRQKMPVIGAHDPWGNNFDATMVYGPLEGRMFYIGFRYNLVKY